MTEKIVGPQVFAFSKAALVDGVEVLKVPFTAKTKVEVKASLQKNSCRIVEEHVNLDGSMYFVIKAEYMKRLLMLEERVATLEGKL